MTEVRALLPHRRRVDLSETLQALAAAPAVVPFAAQRLDFVSDLSRALSRRGRGLPETQALAFWMRKSELVRLAVSFDELQTESVRLMPRGMVFHVPPANVDTIFVYSWILSTLVGNRNIMRMSSRATEQSSLILDTIADVLAEHPAVAQSTSMLTYGHDDEITAQISALSDVRVIWGGDETVLRVRQVPLPPHAIELTFPDRFSMAAIAVRAYGDLDHSEREDLAERFFNDTYWFDQLGCSSARLLIWVGDPGELAGDFYSRVHAVAQSKGYLVETSAAIAKLSQSYRTMIDEQVSGYRTHGNTMTVLDVEEFPQVRGEFCGAGLFWNMRVESLLDVVPHITRRDQTLAVSGFGRDELRELVDALVGRGIDRIVPFGQALSFDRTWDGFDLLQQLTRRVTVDSGGAPKRREAASS